MFIDNCILSACDLYFLSNRTSEICFFIFHSLLLIVDEHEIHACRCVNIYFERHTFVKIHSDTSSVWSSASAADNQVAKKQQQVLVGGILIRKNLFSHESRTQLSCDFAFCYSFMILSYLFSAWNLTYMIMFRLLRWVRKTVVWYGKNGVICFVYFFIHDLCMCVHVYVSDWSVFRMIYNCLITDWQCFHVSLFVFLYILASAHVKILAG